MKRQELLKGATVTTSFGEVDGVLRRYEELLKKYNDATDGLKGFLTQENRVKQVQQGINAVDPQYFSSSGRTAIKSLCLYVEYLERGGNA